MELPDAAMSLAAEGNRWAKLLAYLKESGEVRVVMSLAQVEAILGHPLPATYHGKRAAWRAKHLFPRDEGYRVSLRGVGEGEVAFVKDRESETSHPSVWDGLLGFLGNLRGDEIVLGFAEIGQLRGMALPLDAGQPRSRGRWFGKDKPWTRLGFRASFNGVPDGQATGRTPTIPGRIRLGASPPRTWTEGWPHSCAGIVPESGDPGFITSFWPITSPAWRVPRAAGSCCRSKKSKGSSGAPFPEPPG